MRLLLKPSIRFMCICVNLCIIFMTSYSLLINGLLATRLLGKSRCWYNHNCNSIAPDSTTQSFSLAAIKSRQSNAAENKPQEPSSPSKRGFSLGALVQLVTMGAGAPSLGEYRGTDETGRMIFELEANNMIDSDGNMLQTSAKYFEDGYVPGGSGDFENKPPGFWQNLASGGRLQQEWDQQQAQKSD